MNPQLKAELVRLFKRAEGRYGPAFFHALDEVAACPAYRTSPGEVAELLDTEILDGVGQLYRKERAE